MEYYHVYVVTVSLKKVKQFSAPDLQSMTIKAVNKFNDENSAVSDDASVKFTSQYLSILVPTISDKCMRTEYSL